MRNILMAATLALAAANVGGAAHAREAPGQVSEALLDRVAIENLLASYYYSYHRLGAEVATLYFTPDAEFDANGVIMRGQAEIGAFFQTIVDAPPLPGRGANMLMAPAMIEIDGDRATATTIWTVVKNDTLTAPPRLYEQGHEYDLLVKRDGAWRIAKRIVVTDSGLPQRWQETYVERPADYRPFED